MPPRSTPEERKAKAAARRCEKAAQKKAEKKALDDAAAAAVASPVDEEEEEEVVVTPLKRPGDAAAGASKGSKRPKPDAPSPRVALEVPDKPPSLLVDVSDFFFAKVSALRCLCDVPADLFIKNIINIIIFI